MKLVLVSLALAGLAGVGYMYLKPPSHTTSSYRTVTASRQDFTAAINCTGTIQPEEVVDVGAQVAGRIVAFGKEPYGAKPIDYNSNVEPGTVLALIDDALYREEVNLAKAQYARAEALFEQAQSRLKEGIANVARSEADLKQLEAKMKQASRDWERASKLIKTNVVSQQEYDTYEAANDVAIATLAVGKAALGQAISQTETQKAAVLEAKADIDSAQASLSRAEKNLSYTTIQSPIAGVIIDRRVNIGQTVVASLNAPSLFLIAKDLKKVEVWASVNEADIGRIQEGQKVTFTVDTYPGETFNGAVRQIRLNASMSQNVVTYTVIVSVDNTAGRLRPYLTANLRFEVMHRNNALLVPTTALRWKPKTAGGGGPRGGSASGSAAADGEGRKEKQQVWIDVDGTPRPVNVTIGATNGIETEVTGGDLQEGAEVIVGEYVERGAGGSEVNPLAPKMFSGGKN